MTSDSRPAARHIRDLEQRLQAHMTLFGYDEIDLPVIAPADIFLTRAGSTIIEQLFTFERFGKLLALRPEFTAAAAHRYAQQQHLAPVRWQMSGVTFEDNPADTEAQHERYTVGAELIGMAGAASDAEIIGMAVSGAEAVDLTECTIITGHVGLQWHLLARYGLDARTIRALLSHRETLQLDGVEAVRSQFDNITHERIAASANRDQTQAMLDALLNSTRYGSTMGGRTRHDIAARLLRKQQQHFDDAQLTSALDFLRDWGAIQGNIEDAFARIRTLIQDDDEIALNLLAEWRETIRLVEAHGIAPERMVIQPDLTKNWDYYTGIVFGIRSHEQYIASGGRYDGLTQLLGSDDSVPAVGFAYYLDRLAPLLGAPDSLAPITIYGTDPAQVVTCAQALRAAGLTVIMSHTDEAACLVEDDKITYRDQSYTRMNQLIKAMKDDQA